MTMNEHIRELAEHCDFYVGNEHYDKSHEEQQRLWVEKFAELIVQECANIADEPTSRPFDSYGKKIKKHFGFE